MDTKTEQIFIINTTEAQALIGPQNSAETTQANLQNVLTSNVCRTCAAATEFIIPIFHGEGIQNNLAEKIHKHLPIQVSEQDELPQVVCYQCASTLLAWHELVQCCVQADKALRTSLAVGKAHTHTQEAQPGTSNDISGAPTQQEQDKDKEKNKWNACWGFEKYRAENKARFDDTRQQAARSSISPSLPDNNGVEEQECTDLEDDQPLSIIAADKLKTDVYGKFYHALLNFRDHYVAKHECVKSAYPDYTSSSDSETMERMPNDVEPLGVDRFDDLTIKNMRCDRMDEETRREVSQAQTKINGKLYFVCHICNKRLGSRQTYVFHKRTHTGERPCVCHLCGKRFTVPSGLQRHLHETHERLKRHSCALCNKNFANSQNLKQHMRIHTGEKPFVCAQCGKRFAQSGSLHVHLKTHTEVFPFQCAECGAKFRVRSGLARHRLKHTGERPHACAVCGKSFRQRHELSAHGAAHSATAPHRCSHCPAAFRQRRTLRHHCKKTHESTEARPAPPQQIIYMHAPHYQDNNDHGLGS